MTPDPRGNEPDIGTQGDAGPTSRGPTRRQALVLAGGTAAAFGAAVGPFSHLFVSGAAEGDEPPEIALATWLVGIELAARELYESVRTSTVFDEATQDLAAACAGHHDMQAGALSLMVAAVGATAPSEPNKAFSAEFKPRVDGAGDGAAKAAVFAEMENGFAATYEASLTTITSASLAGLAAQILATDAAQAVAWSAAANGQDSDDPLPPESAIPQSQTTQGQFDRAALTPAPATTTGEES